LPIRVAVFDAYGTLFDVAGAARAAASRPEGARLAQVWPDLARDWRARQLDYTWLRAAAGRHADFAQVTADALDWALEAQGIDDAFLRALLMDLYRVLPAYPEVPATLESLRARGLRTAILSNGTPGMLADAVGSAGIGTFLDAVLSVEEAGVFKPAPQVYDLVGARFGCGPGDVLFVSSNGWDAAAGAGYGFRTVWVNRAGLPQDRLWAAPHLVLPDLSGLPGVVETL
jgi:2-haloacid dehalogenase